MEGGQSREKRERDPTTIFCPRFKVAGIGAHIGEKRGKMEEGLALIRSVLKKIVRIRSENRISQTRSVMICEIGSQNSSRGTR